MAGAKSNTPDDDLFETIARERGLVPPGEYVGELMVATPYSTSRTDGVEAVIKITEGADIGRLVKLRFMENGPSSCDGVISNNALVLKSWLQEIGAPGQARRADGFLGVFKTLWRLGQGQRLIFKIDVRSSPRFGSENILVEVRWDGL